MLNDIIQTFEILKYFQKCRNNEKNNEISNNSLLRIPMNNEEIVQGSHTFKNCK